MTPRNKDTAGDTGKPVVVAPHLPGDDELPDWAEDPPILVDGDDTDVQPKPRKRPRPLRKRCHIRRRA